MATWTNIDDTFLEPGKPVRSADGLALRDNPIAIAEGSSGAPKIQSDAIESLQAGSFIRYRIDFESTSASLSYSTSVLDVTIFNSEGTIRVYAEHRSSAGDTVFLRFLKNGSLIQEFSTASTSFQVRSVDVSFVQGDIIEMQQRSTDVNSQTITRNKRLLTSGGNLWPTTEGYEFA